MDQCGARGAGSFAGTGMPEYRKCRSGIARAREEAVVCPRCDLGCTSEEEGSTRCVKFPRVTASNREIGCTSALSHRQDIVPSRCLQSVASGGVVMFDVVVVVV